MRIAVALLLVMLAIPVAPVRAQQTQTETLKLGDTITGTLRLIKTQHPNGTPIRVYQIVSAAPKRFARKDEFCGDKPPKTFHLLVANNEALENRLNGLLGKTISIEAEDFFCSQTAWHIGDAVVAQWRLKP
ncbi:MAG: hypothetical protein WC670_08085 [Pseudolabrys sp.]|jgi:hypothetical protein